MSSSIYHFFKHLVENKNLLEASDKLENFPFDTNLLSFRRKGKFPDLGIKICKDDKLFEGGELVEVKDSKTFTIASFNSTFPTGEKELKNIITLESDAHKQMLSVGEDLEDLPIRQVYYLIRGKSQANCKVVLIHGSFFEVNNVDDLIAKSFVKVLEEVLERNRFELSGEIEKLMEVFTPKQGDFSKTRQIENYPISTRFRIMIEAAPDGNLLNSAKYEQIRNNTISFILPLKNNKDIKKIKQKMARIFGNSFNNFDTFILKHSYNGIFGVFQQAI
ncbi:MAG TPA: hypothetical protein VK400_06995 [Pyrinomonadaceae bacterium]|nr:hypothetical protein [Pyrinomonadaceae bacterium]